MSRAAAAADPNKPNKSGHERSRPCTLKVNVCSIHTYGKRHAVPQHDVLVARVCTREECILNDLYKHQSYEERTGLFFDFCNANESRKSRG